MWSTLTCLLNCFKVCTKVCGFLLKVVCITVYNKHSFSRLLKRNVINTFACRKKIIICNVLFNEQPDFKYCYYNVFVTKEHRTSLLMTPHYMDSIKIILFLLLLKFVFNISLIFHNIMRNERHSVIKWKILQSWKEGKKNIIS